MFSEQSQTNSLSIQMFVQSFTSMTAETIETTDSINLEPYLAEIEDLSVMECDSQVIQALSFIAGYSTHQFLKRNQVCTSSYQF